MALKSLLSVRKVFLVLFVVASLAGKAQSPTFGCYITNEVVVSPTVYQFDVYLLNTSTVTFEYAIGQWGISVNSAVANGGTLTPSIVSGSSQLSNTNQVPITVTVPFSATFGSYMFNILARSAPSAGSGSIISSVNNGCPSPGTRIASFRITNSVAFATNSTMNHVFNFVGAAGRTQTEIFAYVNSVDSNITSFGTFYSYNTANTCLQNVNLSSCTLTATAFQSGAISCFGGNNGTATVTTTGSVSPTYLWNNGATTQTITGRSAGSYSVTVTSYAGCTATATATVTQPSTVTATCSAIAVTCTGGGNDGSVSVTGSGGTPSYTYLWSTGATTSTTGGLTAGTYTVTITDTHGCTATSSTTVNACNHVTMILDSCRQIDPSTIQFDLFIVSDGSPTSDVRLNSSQWGVNFNTAILKSGASFTPAYVNGSSDFIPPLNTYNFLSNPSEIRIVESAYNNGNTGPSSKMTIGHRYRAGRFTITASATLIGNSHPNFVLQPDTGFIGGLTPTISVAWIGSAASPSNFLSPGTTNLKASLSTACSMTLNPCDLSSTTSITSPSCFGSANGTATAIPSSVNDFEPWTYLWNNGQTNQTAINLSAGTYFVTVTDDALCTATASAIITQPAAFTASASSNSPVCTGGALTLTASAGASYSWTGPNSFSSTVQNPTVTANASAANAGTYTVTVTNANGCVATATTTVTVINCNSTVNVKFYVQGYYVNGGTMKPVMQNESVLGATSSQVDTFTIELHNPTTPYALAENFKGIDSTNGHISCTFSSATIGNSYYIVIKHRNAMETWSASPVAVSATTSYDFSTAATQAFGSNMKLMEAGKYALYSGDVNQDGICNGGDFNVMEADVRAIATGYKKTDINGDGIVNGADFNLLEGNVRAIISKQHP